MESSNNTETPTTPDTTNSPSPKKGGKLAKERNNEKFGRKKKQKTHEVILAHIAFDI